jgi:hypothetical protein
MRESHCRSFTLGDAMILVAATAVGFGVNRVPGWIQVPFAANRALIYSVAIGQAQQAIVPFLMAWTVAFLPIRLRRPRPATRRCLREPGTVACSAASLGILVNALWILALTFAYYPDPRVDFYFRGNDVKVYADRVGFAVVGSWIALVLVRGWRPIPCWIDRLGRTLGWLWIVMIGLHLLQYLIHAYMTYWKSGG